MHLALNRPDKRNAFDLNMIRTLNHAIDSRPRETRVVVISGGAFFCAGADIAVYGQRDLGAIAELTRAAGAMIETISTVPVPVVVGRSALPNTDGITVRNAPDNAIGGAAPSARNVISGNSQTGVTITGAGGTGNWIAGNYIGTTASGETNDELDRFALVVWGSRIGRHAR
mgnify:CR=1 FL=1